MNMNQKGFANIVLIVLIVFLAGVAGYFALNNRSGTPTPSPSPTPTSWQFIDANSFTLSLPPSWKFNKLQGIDSYVGEFVGDGIELTFDFGLYSGPRRNDDDPDYLISYETIDGQRAQIITPKKSRMVMSGIYIPKPGSVNEKPGLSITGTNLTISQWETALKIFRSLKFKK